MAATEASVNRGVAGIGKRLDTIGTRMTSVGRNISAGFTLPFAAVGVASGVMAVRFEDEMGKIRDTAGATQGEVVRMTEAVLDMAGSGDFTHGPQALAEALYRVESAGIRGGDALEYLETASHGAMLGASDLESTTYALVAAMKTGIRGTEELGSTMGTLTSIVGAGNLRMDDLAGAMSTGVLPAAKSVGLGLLDVGAALAVFTSRGVPAQQAATRLRFLFLQMATTKADKVLKEIGFAEGELAATLRGPGGLPAAIGLLHERLQQIPDETKRTQLVLEAFGGGRSGAGMLILLQNLDDLGLKFDQIGGKASQFDKLVEEALAGPAENVEKAWAAIQAALIRTGLVLLPMIADIAEHVADAAEWFGRLSDSTKKTIFVIGGIVAVLGPVLVLFGTMAMAIGGIVTAAGAIAAVSAPVLLLAAAIGVLVAALVMAKVAPDQLEDLLVKLGLSSKQAATLVKGLGIAFDVTFALIRGVVTHIGNAVRLAMDMIGGQLNVVIGILTLDFGRAWDGIKQMVAAPVAYVVRTVKNMGESIKGIFKALWNGLKREAYGIVLQILEPFSKLPGQMGGWARRAKDEVLRELGEMDAAEAEKAAAKLAENFGHVVVPKFGMMGTQAGQTFGTNFLAAAAPSLAGVADAAGPAPGPMATWNERKQKWVDEAGKVIKDQQAAWDALMKKHGAPAKPKPGERVSLQAPAPPVPDFGGAGGGGGEDGPTSILPADLRLREAQAEGNLQAQIQVYRAEQDFLRRLLANRKLGVEKRIEIQNELNRVNSALSAAMDSLNEEVVEEAWSLPARWTEREKVVNATSANLRDDMRFYKSEEKFLTGLLKNKKLSADHKAAIRDELRRVRAQIAKLNDDIWEQAHSQPLWTAKMRIRQTKAERTERLGDDLKVQQDELGYLRRLLGGLGTSKRDMERRAQIEEEITKVMQRIAAIRKEQKEAAEDESKERKAMERMFFSERASFFSSFGSSVFQQGDPSGGEPPRVPGTQPPPGAVQQHSSAPPPGDGDRRDGGGQGGGSGGRPVEVHQHFPERTQNLNREAMYAEQAFKSRFEDDQ